MTCDSSHWHWMLLDCDKGSDDHAEAIQLEIIPHIDHIRASIGSFAESTTNTTSASKKAEEVPTILKRHQILWNQVWSRKAHRGVEEMSIAVDARFTGYHDVAREDDGETLSLEAQEAAKCIQQSFEDWKSGT